MAEPERWQKTHRGWLSPEGEWFYCGYAEHDLRARVIAAERYGWVLDPDIFSRQDDAGTCLEKHGFVRCLGNDTTVGENWRVRAPGAILYADRGSALLTFPQRRELAEKGYDPDNERTPWLREKKHKP